MVSKILLLFRMCKQGAFYLCDLCYINGAKFDCLLRHIWARHMILSSTECDIHMYQNPPPQIPSKVNNADSDRDCWFKANADMQRKLLCYATKKLLCDIAPNTGSQMLKPNVTYHYPFTLRIFSNVKNKCLNDFGHLVILKRYLEMSWFQLRPIFAKILISL